MIKFELPDGTKGRVVFQHDRGTPAPGAWYYILGRGEETGTAGTDCELELTSPSGKVMRFLGSSTLHPGDKFDKEIGRKVSLARALTSSGLGREDRALVWEAYRGRRLKSILAQFQVERRKEQELDSALQQEWDEGHPSCGCRKCALLGLQGLR